MTNTNTYTFAFRTALAATLIFGLSMTNSVTAQSKQAHDLTSSSASLKKQRPATRPLRPTVRPQNLQSASQPYEITNNTDSFKKQRPSRRPRGFQSARPAQQVADNAGSYKKQRPASSDTQNVKAKRPGSKAGNRPSYEVYARPIKFQNSFSRPTVLGIPTLGRPTGSADDIQSRSSASSNFTKFSMSGDAILDFQGNGLSDAPTVYLMKTDLGMQSGSSIMVSDPVIDDSNRRMTVWSFQTSQGPNPHFGNEPLHVIQTEQGLIFGEWKANCRIQIDHASGEVTQIWNGSFQVVGGTGIYRQADGNWDFAMMTEPSQNELSSIALFEFNGSANFDELAANAQYKTRR